MLYLLTCVVCLPLAACATDSARPMETPQDATPIVVSSQEQPEPAAAAIDAAPTEEGEEEKQGEEQLKAPPGPMRVELMILNEERIAYLVETPEKARSSALRIQAKVTGERLAELVGIGDLIIEEMVDDSGTVLLSPDEVATRDEGRITSIRSPKRLLTTGFAPRVAEAPATARAAHKLAKVTGYVEAVYATESEDVMIDNPLQYVGGAIKHPRLQELGMEIIVVDTSEEASEDKRGRGSGIGLHFDKCRKSIKQIEFLDAWMRPLYPRSRQEETQEGLSYIHYGGATGKIDEDTQLLITVYPKIEEQKITFEFTDVDLP